MSHDRVKSERGLGLVEVVMAITILSIGMLALGSLMFQANRDMTRSAAVTFRSAAQQSATAWVTTLNWDSLSSAIGCVADTTGQLTYNRCTTVQVVSSKQKRVTTVLTATGKLAMRPDTIVVERAMPLQPSPFQ